MYQSCGIKYQSPFIGLFILAPDYIFLLEHFDDFLFGNSFFRFITKEKSRYLSLLPQQIYPIGELINEKIGSVEIHFLHYHTEKECLDNWYRRLKRINKDNMIVKFAEKDAATANLIKRFDDLPFNNKVCFTAKKYPLKSCHQLIEFSDKEEVDKEWEFSNKYWDFIEQANLLAFNGNMK